MGLRGVILVLLLVFSSSLCFELDLSSIYKLWNDNDIDNERLDTGDERLDAGDSLAVFKSHVDETLQKTRNGLKEVHNLGNDDHDHNIAKRELPHNLIKDSLGIQILQALNLIYSGDSPYEPEIICLDVTFCSGYLIVAYQFDTGSLKIFGVGLGVISEYNVPLGHISMMCKKDSILIVVASKTTLHSWAAKICIGCQQSPYIQSLAPNNVLAVHQLSTDTSPPRFAFCSGKLVTIMTWKRQYFQAPLVIRTHGCVNVRLVSIHSIDYVIVTESGNLQIYRLKQMSYEHVQSVVIANATDISSFSIGQGISKSFYIIIVNQDDYNPQKTKPVILKWHGDTYLIQQCLNVVEVTGISTVSFQNKLIIVVTSAAQGTVFYQFNGFKFVETFQYSASVLAMPNFVSFAYSPDGAVYLAAADAKNVAVYSTDFFTKNEIADWHETALEACQRLKDRVTADDLAELIHKVRKSFFVNQTDPIVINGSVTFESLTVKDTVVTEEVVAVERNTTYSHSILKTLKELWDKLEESKRKLDKVKEILERALKVSGDQVVNATYYFNNVSLECENCHIDTINVDNLNGHNVSDIQNQVIYTDINETADSLSFVHDLTIKHLVVDGTVNHFNTSDFLYNNSEAVITGKKTFTNDVTIHNLTVDGLVDGVNVSVDNLLLIHGDQNVTGNLNFEGNISVASLHANVIDGVEVRWFYENTVTIDGDHNITGHPIFTHLTLEADLNITDGNLINDVDIFYLYRNAFRIDRNQTISAPYYFEDVDFAHGIVGNFTINGIRFPNDVVRVDEDATLHNNVTFHETITVEDLFVNSSLNGLGIIEDEHFMGQLDILVRNKVQTITGHKSFAGDIHLGNDSIVTGLIDNVDLSELAITVVRKNVTQIIPGTLIVNGSVIFNAPTFVGGFIDLSNLTQIFEHGVRLNTTILPNFTKLTFEENVEAKFINCDNINGVDTTSDLLFKNQSQMISGNKTFTDSIYITGGATIDGLINHVNLTFFDDVLYTHGNQTITADKTIIGDIHFQSLNVTGTVDGKLIPDDLVPLNYTRTVTVITKLHFIDVKINILTIVSAHVVNLVDGVDIQKLRNDSLFFEGEQFVSGNKTLWGGLTIDKHSNLKVTGLINHIINITEVVEDAVLLYEDQVIAGNKTFHNTVVFYRLNFTGLFDHVSDWELRENWLRQHIDQTIYANVTFENDVLFYEGLHVDGLFNRINLTDLYISTVKLDEETTITGPVNLGQTISLGNVTVTGTVNGLNFSEDVVQIHKNYTITGNKTFGDVIITQDLNSPIVDGVDIHDLCENVFLNNGDQNLTGTLTVEGTIYLEDDLIVTESINGINITEFNENVIKIDGNNTIGNFLNITNLTINSPVQVNGSIDGVNFDDFCEHYLSINNDQNITGKYTFEEPVEIEYLRVNSITTTDGEVNGVNIKDLNNTVLKIVGDQVITGNYTFVNTVHFQGDLNVNETVDGLKIPDDVVIIGKNNTIFGQKIFKNLSIWEDLAIADHKTVQTVDVSKWAHSAVYYRINPDGSLYFFINGTKVFDGGVSFGNITVDQLNNLTISEETILLDHGNQTINAEKFIHSNIELPNITVSHINGIDINDLDDRTVKTDEVNNITGFYTFEAVTNFTNIISQAFIDGVNVTRLFEILDDPVDLDQITRKINDTDDIITSLKEAVRHQAVLLNYYYKFYNVPGANAFITLEHSTFAISTDENQPTGCDIVYNIYDPNQVHKYPKIVGSDDTIIHGKYYSALAIRGVDPGCPGFQTTPITSFPGSDDQVEINLSENKNILLFAKIGTEIAIHGMQLFSLNNNICVAVYDITTLKVYCVDNSINVVELLSHNPDGEIQTIAVTTKNNIVYVAINVHKDRFSTDVLFYNIADGELSSVTDCYFPASALHFEQFRNIVFLAVAKKTTHAGFGAIIIFTIKDDGKLEKFQMIYKVENYFVDPLDVSSVLIYDQEMYFIVLSDRIRDNVMLFKYEGAQGFTYHSAVTAKRGQRLNVMGRLLGVTADGESSLKSMLFASEIRGDRPFE